MVSEPLFTYSLCFGQYSDASGEVKQRPNGNGAHERRYMRTILLIVALVPAILSGQGPTSQARAVRPQAPPRAKAIILFLADAGGLSTINAASLHGFGEPRRLFVQRMPHIGLSETSSASQNVTDSAAGMTAIVTGQKTHNGVLSQSTSTVRGKQDGAPLKTILDYAEERGLSTGVISNDAVTGATPAALYAKVNDRGKTAEIFQQAFTPRYGDGVDVLIGAGRDAVAKALNTAGLDLETLGRDNGRPVLASVSEIPPRATRAIVVHANADFDLDEAVRAAHRILSRNPRGYFLMVESDTHTDQLRQGLDRMVEFNRVIERTAALVRRDTLLLFTADHSFDLRIRGGLRGNALLEGLEEAEAKAKAEKRRDIRIPALRMDNGHTGEEVLAAAQGPGAERVRGFMSNTDLFGAMMRAYGWPVPPDGTRGRTQSDARP
jgi:alkaline phosphatase